MILKTSDLNSIRPFINHLNLPKPNSHKGQNGKVLVIGGSSLFHAASIWAAEIASHFVDMVHYSSTSENNEIFLSLKKQFRNGMVIAKKDLLSYVEEDDAILLGPGMIRAQGAITNNQLPFTNYKDVLKIEDEPSYTYFLTKYLLENYPNKKFVLDAGALQMMKPEWLLKLISKPVITPHQGEYRTLFGIDISKMTVEDKIKSVRSLAQKYRCIILLKAVADVISDGNETYLIEGGNAGLTKGGTGDILAGLTVSLFSKNTPIEAAVLSSFILKKTADELFLKSGYWYNIRDIIDLVPQVLKKLVSKL